MILAASVGIFLRILFAVKYAAITPDSQIYIQLARNWLEKGVYALSVQGVLMPVDIRGPGYPAFLAAIFSLSRNSVLAVILAQILLDVGTCFVAAFIAMRLAAEANRQKVFNAALWLAVFCPFTSNYTAILLTETLATFLTALAILVLLHTESKFASNLFIAGIIVGFGTLVRPETPLIFLAYGLILRKKIFRSGALLGIGLILPLVPWAVRNGRTLHEVRFLTPRHCEMPDEYVARGFIDWTQTWLWRYSDVDGTLWKLDDQKIAIDDIPAAAFDSPQERAQVEQLINQYNEKLVAEPDWDTQFRKIANERTARHPLRTYVEIPFLRCVTLWFSPREMLLLGSNLAPLGEAWKNRCPDFLNWAGIVPMYFIYLGLAFAGAWMVRRRADCLFLMAFIVVRTLFISYGVETPEPRYMVECFPVLFGLGAQFFVFRLRPAFKNSSFVAVPR